MESWFELWRADAARRGLAARYVEQQRTRIKHLATFAGPLGLTRADVRRWLDHLQAVGMPRERGKVRPCSAKTLNNHLAGVRVFFRWCRRAGLIDHDPADGIEWARVKKGKGRVLSARQAWAIFEAAQQDESSPTPRLRDKRGRVNQRSGFYRTIMATGMRAGAAESLRVRDFELNADPPRIIIRAENDKSGAERSLIIAEDDRAWFAARLRGRQPGEVAFRRPHHRELKADAEAAGVPARDSQGRQIGYHCFRRWYGSEMDRQGFSVEQIRQRLGHKDATTTMNYLVRELEEQQGVAERLSQVVKKSFGKSVDIGDKIADTGSATNGPLQHPSEQIGERPAPAVCRYSNGAGPPVSFDTNPPGSPPGRHISGQQAPASHSESGRQDLNLTPGRDAEGQQRLDLLRRMMDLLERETRHRPEVSRESPRVQEPDREWGRGP